ncbi:MAG: C25 family cysteine peptidase, partial [bacterium]
HNRFALTLGGQRIAVRTKGQDKAFGKPSKFGPGGYIEFYAPAADDMYTNQVAYTLHLKKGLRKSIGKQKLKFKQNQGAATDYQHTALVEENRDYDFMAPSKTDPWHYGQVFGVGAITGPEYSFELDEVSGTTADFSVEVFGIVDLPGESNDHHVEIVVNGQAIGDKQFDGATTTYVNAGGVAVSEGTNSMQVNLKGIADQPFDALALNQFDVTYSRNTVAGDDYLQGRFAPGQATVSGLSSAEVTVYRKDDAGVIKRITGTKSLGQQGDSYVTGIATGSASAEFMVVGANGYKTPAVAMINDLDDISSGDAEYLVISHASFMGPELDGLVQIREADYSVKVVDVAQVYGQFGNHVPSADAIHAYVKYAAANMGTRYVLLVGSDTYDYKNYVSNSVSFVPTYYATTPGGQLIVSQTPSDAKYGDLDDDDVPDIAVGRISARTPTELGYVVEKIRDYRAREGYIGRIVMATDKEDVGNGVSFTDDADALINAISEPAWRNAVVGPNRAFFRAYPDVDGDQVAHDKLITALNTGVSVAAYIGHSSQSAWAYTTPIMLSTADVSGLTNIDKPALVMQWGCWNTYFVDPAGNSMGDQFLVGSEAGAVTVLGASSLTSADGERKLGLELNQRMYQKGMTIGDAVVQAKQAMAVNNPGATDILLGWQIIGDPALVVSP